MSARTRGFVLPLVLMTLVWVALAAAGAAWTARAQWAAEQSAAMADRQFAAADSVLHDTICDPGTPGATRRVETVTSVGVVRVFVRYARGACWATVAVGDGAPLMGTLLMEASASVTPLANASPLGLPSIEASSEFPVSHSAPLSSATRGRPVPGPSWLDLR